MFKILIVEDARGIAEGIQSLLEQWGMEARQVQDFRNITGEFETYQPHLILLDIKLPSYDGYYWCGQLRQRTAAPIIFISSAADNMNIVMAMNMAAMISSPSPLTAVCWWPRCRPCCGVAIGWRLPCRRRSAGERC